MLEEGGRRSLRSAAVKDILREIRRTSNRFLSIFAIVALGAGFFAGLKATCPDMLATGDSYFAEQNLLDIRLVSTYGFSEKDLEAIRGVPGVRGVQPSYFKDVFIKNNGNANILARVMALPDGTLPDYTDASVNRADLLEGRLPESADECVIEKNAQMPVDFEIGDVLTVYTNDPDDPPEDSLARTSFTVVGVVRSPRYLSFERGGTDIGNGALDTYIMVNAENFTSDVFTEVSVTLADTEGVSAFSDAYEDAVEHGKDLFEALADVREVERYAEIREEADEKLADAERELEGGELTANAELRDARVALYDAKRELQDARVELYDGWAEYHDGQAELADAKEEFAEKIADAEEELADGREELDDGWDEYHDGLDEYKAGLKKLERAKEKLEDAQAQLDAGVAAAGFSSLAEFEGYLNAQQGALDAERRQLDLQEAQVRQAYAAGLIGEAELDASLAEIAGYRRQLDAAQAELSGYFSSLGTMQSAQAEIDAGWEEYRDGELELEEAKDALSEARRTLRDAEEEWEQGRLDLEEARAEGQEEIGDAEKELADAYEELAEGEEDYAEGLKKYEDGREDYEEAKADADEELADAREKIADAKEELADLRKPVWYVFDRSEDDGYSTYDGDSHRIEAVASVFPVFFFLVAVLVCLTTMTRMVEEQRTEIGTYKALGYRRGQIASKFLIYASAASVTGAAAGIAAGTVVFPEVIYNAYALRYLMPGLKLVPDWNLWILVTLVCLACTALAAIWACDLELRAAPAELMRPRAPKPGKRVFLESVGFIWKRLSFLKKVTVRNLFRYKRRMLMTVIGIAGCTALTLTGFGLYSSISRIMERQYSGVFLYDLTTALDENATEAERKEFYDALGQNPIAANNLPVYEKSAEIDGVPDAYFLAFEDGGAASRFISFHERVSGKELALSDDGVLITEKLSEELGLSVGDPITFTADGERITAPITGITENYVFHFIYMTKTCWERYDGVMPEPNLVLTIMSDPGPEAQNALASDLIQKDAVLGLTFVRDSRDSFAETVENLNYVVVLIILSAAALALTVLYNLTNINITERIREIATLKVLGFYDRETSAYVFRESLVLSLIGDAVGLGLGVYLHRFIIGVAETDAIMFGRDLPAWCYFAAFATTIVFTLLVDWIMYFRLKKIGMVESMKSVE